MAKRVAAAAGRPRQSGSNGQRLSQMVFARVDEATVNRLEAFRADLEAANPGRLTATSEAVRVLILQGLAAHEGGRRGKR